MHHPPFTGDTNMLIVNVDTTNTENAFVVSRFMFPRYSCTIDYGTDPSYTNLVYSDASTTLGQVTTIALSQDLQRDTTYYFIVTANSRSRCERVRGRFRTGGYKNSGVCMHSMQERGEACVWMQLFYHLPPGNIAIGCLDSLYDI